MSTLTTKSIWKLAIKEDCRELRYLIINKFDDINMSYKYRLCP